MQKKVNLNVRLNTLFQKMGLKGVKEIKEFLVGRYVIPVTNNIGGHTFPLNEPILIDSTINLSGVGNANPSLYGLPDPYGFGTTMHIYFSELVLGAETKEILNRELKSLEARKQNLELETKILMDKLTFLEETKSTEVKPEEFKRYKLQKLLADKTQEDGAKISMIMELLAI